MSFIRISITAGFLFTSTLGFAQSRHFSSATLGMGGGGTAYADGYHANFINPANLALKTRSSNITIGILGGVGANVGGPLANFGVYNEYLTTGRTIDGQTRVNMLNAFFGTASSNVRQVGMNTSILPLGISVRTKDQAFSLALRTNISSNISVSKGLAELAFYGFDSDKFGSPTPANFRSEIMAYGEISLGYARKVFERDNMFFADNVKIFVGAAPKYLMGLQAFELNFNSDLTVRAPGSNDVGTIEHSFNYDVVSYGELSNQMQQFVAAHKLDSNANMDDYLDASKIASAGMVGSGFGLDLGATAEMDISNIYIPVLGIFGSKKILRLSMSITDLGGFSISKNPSKTYAQGSVYLDGDVGDMSLGDYYDNLADSLVNNVYMDLDNEDLKSVRYQLPGMYNFGGSLNINKLLLAFDYGFGFNHRGTNSRRSVMNLGVEYRLFNFIPLRVGTRVGGYSSTAYSAGIGVDFSFLEFTLAASMVKNSSNNGSALAAAWSGFVIRF